MEYVYSALLLHSAKKGITEESVNSVLKAAGVTPDSSKVKALLASLKEVNIDEAIEKASIVQAPAAAGSAGEAEKKAEKSKEEEQKSEEEAAAGLSSLFG